MKKIAIILTLIPQLFFAQFISDEIKPLVKYIEQCNTSPVDYVMNLFETYDVVVIGERDHGDMTQYDLIQQIISDPRFITKVGHVITEIGVYNMADELNNVLKGTYPHDTVFDLELVKTLFYNDYITMWEKTNYTKLLKDVYLVNKNLPTDQKISVTPTDMSFSWRHAQTMTGEECQASVHKMWDEKDLIMGINAVNELYRIFDGKDSRKKALIIYNTPHSCRYFETNDSEYRLREKHGIRAKERFFAYQIIADRFPGRVANVMLNWTAGDDIGSTEDKPKIRLSNDGKIDAAFAACNQKSIGFDLANSPFGDYLFDVLSDEGIPKEKLKDIYHGFIFYKPVEEWVLSFGVPNLNKLDCIDELIRREEIFMNRSIDKDKLEEHKKWAVRYYTTIRTFPVTMNGDNSYIHEQIEKYYKSGR